MRSKLTKGSGKMTIANGLEGVILPCAVLQAAPKVTTSSRGVTIGARVPEPFMKGTQVDVNLLVPAWSEKEEQGRTKQTSVSSYSSVAEKATSLR